MNLQPIKSATSGNPLTLATDLPAVPGRGFEAPGISFLEGAIALKIIATLICRGYGALQRWSEGRRASLAMAVLMLAIELAEVGVQFQTFSVLLKGSPLYLICNGRTDAASCVATRDLTRNLADLQAEGCFFNSYKPSVASFYGLLLSLGWVLKTGRGV
jgi:hypothetical protein